MHKALAFGIGVVSLIIPMVSLADIRPARPERPAVEVRPDRPVVDVVRPERPII